MDIVTHGMMGVVLAAPALSRHPEAACAFMVGSALPDADVLSRLLGKRAFLRCHQTYAHSLPVIAGLCVGLHLALYGTKPGGAALGLGLGMAFHSLLDWTNTYGTKLWAPFSRKRCCAEWAFFIDLPVVLATVWGLLRVWREASAGRLPGAALGLRYGAFLAVYGAARFLLRLLALRRAPAGTTTLLPTAFLPWRFLGAERQGDSVRLFTLDALTGRVLEESSVAILDPLYEEALAAVPEFKTMRELSPLFHAVSAVQEGGETVVTCRDLRTRNFGTRFGELRVRLGPGGGVRDVEWNV
ncbi:MAG: metal-dependent hydrolase [Elusimicrobia bacterium]|nr:metal-dependent hydrolase [Elusimicrobiota bacterium]